MNRVELKGPSSVACITAIVEFLMNRVELKDRDNQRSTYPSGSLFLMNRVELKEATTNSKDSPFST